MHELWNQNRDECAENCLPTYELNKQTQITDYAMLNLQVTNCGKQYNCNNNKKTINKETEITHLAVKKQ